MQHQPQLLRLREVATILGVSRTTAYRLVQRGVLKGVWPSPGALRVWKKELDAYVKSLDGEVAIDATYGVTTQPASVNQP